MTELAIDLIRTDGGTQPRAVLDLEAAEDYAEAMRNGAQFPPVTVFYDGSEYWLADGFHRVAGAKLNDAGSIEADIRPGTLRDAVLHSCGANAEHGMRRTNADKRRVVRRLLEDEQWSQWSQVRIAEVCGVSREFVNRVASQLYPVTKSQDTVIAYRGGKEYALNTSNLGKPRPTPRPARDIVAAAVQEHRREDRDENMLASEARRLVERLLTVGAGQELPDAKTAAESLPGAFASEDILGQLESLIDWLADLADALTDRLQREAAYAS